MKKKLFFAKQIKGNSIVTHPTLKNNINSYFKFDGNLLNSKNGGYISGSVGFTEGKIKDGINVSNTSNVNGTDLGINLNSEYSISVWAKLLSAPTSDSNQIFSITTNGYPYYGFNIFFRYASNNIVFNRIQGAGTDDLKTTTTLNTIGAWTHYVYTYKNGFYSIYQNGIRRGSGTTTNTNIPTTNTKYFGIGYCWGAQQPNNMLVDEMGVWSRELTNDEVIDLYNNNSGLPYN